MKRITLLITIFCLHILAGNINAQSSQMVTEKLRSGRYAFMHVQDTALFNHTPKLSIAACYNHPFAGLRTPKQQETFNSLISSIYNTTLYNYANLVMPNSEEYVMLFLNGQGRVVAIKFFADFLINESDFIQLRQQIFVQVHVPIMPNRGLEDEVYIGGSAVLSWVPDNAIKQSVCDSTSCNYNIEACRQSYCIPDSSNYKPDACCIQ